MQEIVRAFDDQKLDKKVSRLENQLLELKIQEINLKRINRNLEETIRTAMHDQSKEKDFNSCQKLYFDKCWKEKYEQQAQKNIESMKYIKLLQTKKRTISYQGTKNRPSNTSAKSNLKLQNKVIRQPLSNVSYSENVFLSGQKRSNSVKKMQNFMGNLLKDKYQTSEFLNYTNFNSEKEKQRTLKIFYSNNDHTQELFLSAKRTNRNLKPKDCQQNQLLVFKNISLRQNKRPNKVNFFTQNQHLIAKKLSLTTNLR